MTKIRLVKKFIFYIFNEGLPKPSSPAPQGGRISWAGRQRPHARLPFSPQRAVFAGGASIIEGAHGDANAGTEV
ncbi:MAG: hypothetical protein FWD39_04915 [Clostridiales bacterium]|nr:hypothetical protein [Clostridiales bacterium]